MKNTRPLYLSDLDFTGPGSNPSSEICQTIHLKWGYIIGIKTVLQNEGYQFSVQVAQVQIMTHNLNVLAVCYQNFFQPCVIFYIGLHIYVCHLYHTTCMPITNDKYTTVNDWVR